jgi:hypothetical protein
MSPDYHDDSGSFLVLNDNILDMIEFCPIRPIDGRALSQWPSLGRFPNILTVALLKPNPYDFACSVLMLAILEFVKTLEARFPLSLCRIKDSRGSTEHHTAVESKL